MRKSRSSPLSSDKEAKAAQKEVVRGLRGWMGAHFPEHHADLDEARDPLELHGYSESHHNVDFLIPVEPDMCLGVMCPLRSDACDTCKFANQFGNVFGFFNQSEKGGTA